MERRQFTREFKLEAVRLIKDRGVSYVQASQDLNVHPSQLRDWVKKFSESGALWTKKGPSADWGKVALDALLPGRPFN